MAGPYIPSAPILRPETLVDNWTRLAKALHIPIPPVLVPTPSQRYRMRKWMCFDCGARAVGRGETVTWVAGHDHPVIRCKACQAGQQRG